MGVTKHLTDKQAFLLAISMLLISCGLLLLLQGCNFVEVNVHSSERAVLNDGSNDEQSLQRGEETNTKANKDDLDLSIPLK